MLLDVFLPRRCLYCKESIRDKIFCNLCMSQILPIKDEEKHLISGAFIYGGLIRELIVRAKFKPDESIGRLLARFLEWNLKNTNSHYRILDEEYDLVTYIPSHWRRRFTRQHELPALIASVLARSLKLPLGHVLECTRYDPPLSTSRSAQQRLSMVYGRFRARAIRMPTSKILLIDDVTTTGITLTTAAKALEISGHKVACFAFAKSILSSTITSSAASLHK